MVKESKNDSWLLRWLGGWYMERIELHPDFKDFLRLLNSYGVEYLLVGGHAATPGL